MERDTNEHPVRAGEEMVDERREYRRTPRRIKIEFHKTHLFFLKGEADVGEAVDISTSGIRFNTKMELEEGDSVCLLMRCGDNEPEVAFNGKVAWAGQVKQEGHAFRQVGVEFARLGLKQRVLLVRLATGA